MKKNGIIVVAVLLLVSFFSTDALAQSKKRSSEVDKYFDESGFKHRLWYGGGFNLGFSGGVGQSVFQLGISPMVGYKAIPNNDNFSVGPRVSLLYTYLKVQSGSQVYTSQPLSYSYGVFARYKILPIIFAHAEYEIANEAYTTGNVGADNKLLVERQSVNNAYIGLGYNSGGLISYEALLLYNALEPANSPNLPFDFRIGFNYKF